MIVLELLLAFVLFLVIAGAFGLFFASLTGYNQRAYPVLCAQDEITIAGKAWKVQNLAEEYQPQMKIRETNPSPPLLWTFYNAVHTEGGVDLVYYQVWEDEIHPDPLIHAIYRFFRSAYYGSPVRDIEYFQVSVSTQNGDVNQLMFETSPQDDYFVNVSEHLIARYTRRSDGRFDLVKKKQSGVEFSQEKNVEMAFEDRHPLVLAQTWNHLSRLVMPEDQHLISLASQAKDLTSDDYSKYKFVRKSQGDHRTEEAQWVVSISKLGYVVLLPGIIYMALCPKKK